MSSPLESVISSLTSSQLQASVERMPTRADARERGLSKMDEVVLLDRARRRLGIVVASGSDYGRRSLTFMRRRIREGYTPAQLLAVTEYARAQWDGGQRFHGLKDLLWLWGTKFPAHLAAAAHTRDAHGPLVHREGGAMAEWQEDVQEMLRRQEDA